MIRIIVEDEKKSLLALVEKLIAILYEKEVDYFVDTNYSRRMSDRIFVPGSDFQFIIGSREAEEDTVYIRKYGHLIRQALQMHELPEFLLNNNLISII
jgi:hypothetical protein